MQNGTPLKQAFRGLMERARSWFGGPGGNDLIVNDLHFEEQKTLLAQLLVDGSRKPEIFPASFSQFSLWYVTKIDPVQSAYNLQAGLRLRGDLDRTALQSSLQEITNRHDILRTTFLLDENELAQVVMPTHTVDLPFVDLSHLPESTRLDEAYALAAGEAHTVFDLARLPLFRLKLIELARDDHIFICVMHHIVSDGWSMGLFLQELATLYGAFSLGLESPLLPPAIQYGDYAQWQREWLTGDSLNDQLQYWKKTLQGAHLFLNLPTDHPRPSRQTLDGASQYRPLSRDLVRDVRSLSAETDTTFFMVTVAVFNVLLFEYSDQEDILVGVPTAGRSRLETEDLIGLFVNMLVLRTDLSGNPYFSDLLARVREAALDAFCNADIPFAKLVEELKPARSANYNPIFQVLFAVIKAATQSDHFGALIASPYVVATRTSRFDLTMNLIEGAGDNWTLELEYNTALFDHERVRRMLDYYVSLLHTVVDTPRLHLSDLPRPPL